MNKDDSRDVQNCLVWSKRLRKRQRYPLFEVLREMRADRRGDDEDFVLTSQKGGQLSVSQAWRIAIVLADEASVTKKVSPHTWHHPIATQLLDAGAPLHKVSSFLGHSDPKITVKAYYSESEGLKVEDFIDVEG